MKIQQHTATSYGTPVSITLSPNEVATAILAYCVAHGVHIQGPRTTSMDGKLLRSVQIYVDPSGFVIKNGVRYPRKTS